MFRLQQQVKETRIRKETGQPVPKIGHIRVQKDVNELDIPPSFDVRFPDPNDLMHFELTISPEEGYYNNGAFDFTIQVPEDYPHKPPKVKCTTLIYHPNIDLQGNVCLNILRQDWKPVLSLSSVLYGLQLLFLEPNPDDPLNKDAANLLKRDRHEFQKNVTNSIRGGYVAVSLNVERDVSLTNLYSAVLGPEYVFTKNCWEQVYKGFAEDYSHTHTDSQSQRR